MTPEQIQQSIDDARTIYAILKRFEKLAGQCLLEQLRVEQMKEGAGDSQRGHWDTVRQARPEIVRAVRAMLQAHWAFV
jgi:hypothetical protein